MGREYPSAGGVGLPLIPPRMKLSHSLQSNNNSIARQTDKVKTRSMSPTPFSSTKWRYSKDKERIQNAIEQNTLRAYPQPKYSDPGFNTRNGACAQTGAATATVYNLRERKPAMELSAQPWRFNGFRTERERVEWQLDKFAPRTLAVPEEKKEIVPHRRAHTAPEAATAATEETRKKSPAKFQRHIRGNGLFGSDGMSKEYDPFVDRKHVDTSNATEFRSREPEKEILQRDSVKQRVGFQTAVPSGRLFDSYRG